jgi:mannose-6-phosphate isomerase-like protein (cupin superfamily)
MRLTKFALLAALLAPLPATAVETHSSSPFGEVIARATVPDRNDEQLYLTMIAGTFWATETHKLALSDEIYYQYSGIVDIAVGNKTTTLEPGQAIFIEAGSQFTLRAKDPLHSSAYLQFLLSPTPESGVTTEPNGRLVEVFRSPTPVPGLTRTRNLLTLTRVPLAPQSLPDPLHQRTGAALHYVLSGVGAEFAEGQTTARGPGSVSYEPAGFAYQWSNPGLQPLTYLLFNVSPRDVDPVIAADQQPKDPFSRDPHLTVAIYCVAISMMLMLVLSSGAMADYHRDRRNKADHDDSNS